MDNENELQDSQTPDEELEPEENQDEEVLEDTSDDEPSYEDLEASNKKLYARTKQAESDNKKLKDKLAEKSPILEEDVNKLPDIGDDALKRLDNLELSEQKRQFGFDHNLSPEATDFVFKQSGNGDPKEALGNKFVKVALDSMKAQERADKASISPTSKSVSVKGKTFASMTEEERKENFGKVVEKIKGK